MNILLNDKQLLNDIKNINGIEHPFSLIAIKDTFHEHPNRFLLYYDVRWKCWLFPNIRSDGSDTQNEQNIRERISHDLKININQVNATFLESRIQTKFSVSDQIQKVYEHKLYKVVIPIPKDMHRKSFEKDGCKYCWMSKYEMLQDDDIRKNNLDVVEFITSVIQ